MKPVSDGRWAQPSLQLSLKARSDSLRLLRSQLCIWLGEARATSREQFEIILATTEAFSNAVKHPLEPTSNHVEIEGTLTNRTINLSVHDYGRWREEPAVRHEGGLGFAIMDELMDWVLVEPAEDGTTVTMRRQLAMR